MEVGVIYDLHNGGQRNMKQRIGNDYVCYQAQTLYHV